MDIHNNGRNNNKFDRFFNYRNNDSQGMVRPLPFGQWRWLSLSIYNFIYIRFVLLLLLWLRRVKILIAVDVTFN
jgi:hypothetical protein